MARMVSRKDTQNQLILLYQKKKKFSPPKILLDKYKCCTCILMTSVYTLYSTSSNKEKKFFFWLLMQFIYYFRWNWGQRILIQWGISHQNAKYSPKSTKIKNLHLLRYFATKKKKITVNLYVYMFIITCKSFLFPFILTLLYYSNM